MRLTDGTDDQLMAIAAFRYCLGRQSYIVGAALDWLRATWGDFAANTRNVIVRDAIEALMDGSAGSETIDAPGWRAFLEWAWPRLDDAGRDWVRADVAHKRKPMPFNDTIGGTP